MTTHVPEGVLKMRLGKIDRYNYLTLRVRMVAIKCVAL